MNNNTLAALEQQILAPSAELIEDIKKIQGDILFLGIGGKMGPSMAKLAIRAIEAAGIEKKVIGVSRFSTKELQQELEDIGISTIACDLLDPNQLKQLPQVPNVIYLAGHKFGTTGNEDFTWAMNTYLPGMVASHFENPILSPFHRAMYFLLCPSIVPEFLKRLHRNLWVNTHNPAWAESAFSNILPRKTIRRPLSID